LNRRAVLYNRTFEIGFASHAGNRKKINQDSVLIKVGEHNKNEFGLFAVADGMGGLAAGEEAGRMAIEELNNWWNECLYELINKGCIYKPSCISNKLEHVFKSINSKIRNYADREACTMGTTLTVLFIYENRYFVKHIGDSRLYVLNSKINKITEDHSWVAQEVSMGRLTEEEAGIHPRRNILTQCLGVYGEFSTFTYEGEIETETHFLFAVMAFMFISAMMKCFYGMVTASGRPHSTEPCRYDGWQCAIQRCIG
jgi:serine/threonine protein phosphatase PrpC